MKAFKHLLLSLIFLFPTFLFSQPVTEKQAKTIAKNFFYEKLNVNKTVSYEDIELRIKQTYTKSNTVVFRVFEPLNQTGFILVSSDECIIPVLAYSTENLYETENELPPNFKEWVESYASQIESAVKDKNDKNPLWELYSVKPDLNNVKSTKDVTPLLTTTWNQGCGYNTFCPDDNSGPCNHVWAGCVATAMAQVMNYHEHPVSGEDTSSYTHYTYGYQFADYGNAVYDWDNMPDNSGNTEIAELIYHCGVSVRMNYSPSGSGAYSSNVVTAWKNYFKYSSNLLLTSKNSYTDENWAKMLMSEIDAGRPLYYHGYGSGGHAFNVDGYQGTDYFHFNWGWGGSYNGYFYLDNLNPAGHNYSNSQGAIVGAQDRDLYPGLDCSGLIVLSPDIPHVGTTIGSVNIVNKYGTAYYHSTGKEVVHEITTAFPGRIRASISGLGENDLDVFILSHCNQDSLLAYGDTTAVADDMEVGTYYIVVDGKYGSEGNYTLTVTVPSNEPDLIIVNQKIEPNTIEAGEVGFISFKIKNIGNNSAAASKTNIYYSEDAIFDGTDILIEQINIPLLASSSEHMVNQQIIIPGEATEGSRYILFVVDAENDVEESDEIYNTGSAWFNVPAAGIMDCSASVSLSSGIWYFGNTETDGQSNIDMYTCAWMNTEKEVIHSITATHSGLATIEFTEKIPGRLNVLALTSCNENTCLMSFGIWNPEDTLMHESMQVYAGLTYYFVVDGEAGVSGNYGLKIKMPEACPNPYISSWGETDICESAVGASLYTDWGYSDIQWYKDNILLEGQTFSNLWATETGDYKVEVTENECSAFSETIPVRISPEPSHADITAVGDTTFCEGNNVTLDLNTGVGYTIQWMKNSRPVEGENTMSFLADETGIYTAEVTNISCSINSNAKQITAHPVTADIEELARVSSKDLVSHFSCDMNDNTDLSGNGNDYFGSWDFPEDRHGHWTKAQYYNGQWDQGTTTNTFNNPNTFTLSVWINTSTNTGGMIVGLGDSQWGGSINSDRMIYMDDSGKLHFAVMNGTAKAVSTANSYNDGNWHLVNASLSSSGMKLFVDGQLKAEDVSVTSGANYTGWWKIAYDSIDSGFPNVPTSLYYQGIIDEIKVYERELLAGEISYLFEESLLFDATLSETVFCESGSTDIVLSNTEAFVDYQLRDDADNSLIGSAITGNTETINLPTGVISETTTYNILATNTLTACSFELSELFTVSLEELPTAILTGGETICPTETSDLMIDFSGTAPWDISYTDGTDTFTETTSDNPYVFTVSDAGTYEITGLSDANCTGSDISGTATIIIDDSTAPVADEAILPDINGECEVNLLTTPTATDNCVGSISGTHDAVLPITTQGTTLVTWTYDDGNGNTSTQNQNIVINDISNPTISCPDNQTVYADGTHNYAVSGNEFDPIAADDNCTIASILNDFNNATTLNSALLSEGITTVVWTVSDEAGNNESCSFDVIVNAYGTAVNAVSENEISIYPNPTNGIITIEAFGKLRITITDINGKKVFNSLSASDQREIDMSPYGPGLYFLKLTTEREIVYKKVIVR